MFCLCDVVSDYEYIVPLLKDFSRQKIIRNIHPANEIQNQVKLHSLHNANCFLSDPR